MNADFGLKTLSKTRNSATFLHVPSGHRILYLSSRPRPEKDLRIREFLTKRNTLDHPNLGRLFSVFFAETGDQSLDLEKGEIGIFCELGERKFGDERELRFRSKVHWTETELLNTLEVLLLALDALHSHGLSHGNITANSIVFSSDGFVKLSDQFVEFPGILRSIPELLSEGKHHISPEVLAKSEVEGLQAEFPGKESDLWQIGMVFLEACILRPCLDLMDYNNKSFNFIELENRIKEVGILKSQPLAKILRVLLSPNPSKRLEIMEFVKKNWPYKTPNNPNPKKPPLRNSSNILNVSLNPKTQKIAEPNNNSKKSGTNVMKNKENIEVSDPQKNAKYQEILEILEKYKNPSISQKTPKPEENLIHSSSNNLVTFFPWVHNTLEGILEVTEETQESEETLQVPSTADPLKNPKFIELEAMFLKSRARTNEILTKGLNLAKNAGSSEMLSSSIAKIEKSNNLSTVYYTNRDRYEGDLKADQRHGFGVYYLSTGQILYQGEWSSNQYSGSGILNHPGFRVPVGGINSSDFSKSADFWLKYEGEFKAGRKEGNGILIFSNKEYFQGCFRGDKVHGFGCFHAGNGSLVFGEWCNEKILRFL